ncbi:MAG: S9 family peptidase [Phycisphaerae bacterium]|nr:MAG: S9 family peptidase [Phycisphaerae bacterium]
MRQDPRRRVYAGLRAPPELGVVHVGGQPLNIPQQEVIKHGFSLEHRFLLQLRTRTRERLPRGKINKSRRRRRSGEVAAAGRRRTSLPPARLARTMRRDPADGGSIREESRMFKTIRMLLLLLPACALTAGVRADDIATRTRDITLEDYFTISNVLDAVLSPDGEHAVYVETRWEPPAEPRNADLWIVSTRTKEVRRLTFEPGSDASPQWSPDSKVIYFAAARKREPAEAPYNGRPQVWRIGVEGGEPQPVTRLPEGIGLFQLSRDGRTLYYTISEGSVDEPWKALKEKYSGLQYGHGVERFSELWKLDLTTWRRERILAPKRVITALAVAPDERRLAMITAPGEHIIHNEGASRVEVYDARTLQTSVLPDAPWRAEAPSPYGWLIAPAWADDGAALAFRIDFDGHPGEIFIAQFADDGTATTWKMKRPREVSLGHEHLEWMPGRRDLVFLAEDRARERVYCVQDLRDGGQGAALVLTPGDVCVDHFNLARSADRALVVMNTLTHPQDLFLVSGSGDATKFDRLTRLNPQVDTWKLPRIELVRWTAPDGTEVEGVLELPPDYKEGQRLPMVVEIHGGPTASVHYMFQFWIYGRTLLPARGWALFAPNYRGSTGYGDKFLTDLIGRENDVEVQDILSGVDAMIERGVADPQRLAVMGWSNGGYLTNCIITRTDRFKAASSGAGIFDVVLQWIAEDTPGHVINFMQGFPWNQADVMRRCSPLYLADKIRTPTLVHVGENDERCPPEHSRGLHRALHQYLKVPCELIVYPGEPHGLTRYTHRKAKMEWDIAWLDHYVLEASSEDAAPSPAGPIGLRSP